MNGDDALSIHSHGIRIERNFVSSAVLEAIHNEVSSCGTEYNRYGIRNAEKKFASINALVRSERFINKAKSILGGVPDVVRVIFFDKTADKNWLVTWHQDKTIAVNAKADIAGWGPWSIKDGDHHVQPDLSVLSNMITLRLHLDDAGVENGCLQVIPQSHQLGVLSQEHIQQICREKCAYTCDVKAGDLVIMKPLILHCSSKSIHPGHRRVVHVEYSNFVLPEGLSWA